MNPNLGSRQAQPRQEARRDSSSVSAPKGAVTCLLSPLQTPPQDTRPGPSPDRTGPRGRHPAPAAPGFVSKATPSHPHPSPAPEVSYRLAGQSALGRAVKPGPKRSGGVGPAPAVPTLPRDIA